MIHVLDERNIPREQAIFNEILRFRYRVFIEKLHYAEPNITELEQDNYDKSWTFYLGPVGI